MTKFVCMALVSLLLSLTAALALAQQRDLPRGLPWGAPPGPADPLEPWSLEPQGEVRQSNLGAGAVGAGVGVALPTPTLPTPTTDPRLDAPPDLTGILPADSTAVDATSVVLLQQILIENPHQARQLRDLFDAGVSWSSARPLLKLGTVQEYTREYALEDLAAEMALEIAALPDSTWSSEHPWRGRTMFFLVLARAERSRASLPALGAGLNSHERNRLVQLHPNLRQPVIKASGETSPSESDLVAAVLEKQEQPIFPEEANMDGEVTLLVFIGRQGDVTKVTVVESTSILFEKAAIEAAQRSVFRSATRNGVPEPSSLKITYPFRVPGGQGAVQPTP